MPTQLQRFIGPLSILLFLAFSLSANATEAEAIQVNKKEVTPADVFVQVGKIQAELELLRFYMGKPRYEDIKLALNIQNAAPREVFFQALTLIDKTNTFSFDQMRTSIVEPATPNRVITPADVFNVTHQALTTIRAVKRHIGIQQKIDEPVLDATKTPSDVLLAIINTNRQLNMLLDQQFSTKDAFKKVSLAVSYSARLLSAFPNATRIPEAEPFIIGKLPSDVFRRLLSNYQQIQTIVKRSNLTALIIEIKSEDSKIIPSDVYDMASFIVSELAYINSKTALHTPPHAVFDSARKFPSDVFQRVSILEQQIKQLDAQSKQTPLWLSGSSSELIVEPNK